MKLVPRARPLPSRPVDPRLAKGPEIPFGRFLGWRWPQVAAVEPGYVAWAWAQLFMLRMPEQRRAARDALLAVLQNELDEERFGDLA